MKNPYCMLSLMILIHVCLTGYSQPSDIDREIDEQVGSLLKLLMQPMIWDHIMNFIPMMS